MAEEKPSQPVEKPSAEEYRIKLVESASKGQSLLCAMTLLKKQLDEKLTAIRETLSDVKKVKESDVAGETPLTDIKGNRESDVMARLRVSYSQAVQLIFLNLRQQMQEKYDGSAWRKLEDLMRDKVRWGRVGFDKKFIPFTEEGEAANIAVVDDVAWFGFGFPKKNGCQVHVADDPGSKPLIMVCAEVASPFWAGLMLVRGLLYVEEIVNNPQFLQNDEMKKRMTGASLVQRWKLLKDYADPGLMEAYTAVFKKEKIVSRNDVVRFFEEKKAAGILNKLGRLFTDAESLSEMEKEYRKVYQHYFFMLAFNEYKRRIAPDEETSFDVEVFELSQLMDLVNMSRVSLVTRITNPDVERKNT